MKKLFLILIIVHITSCATLFSSSNDDISITSEPAGAIVYLNSKKIGKTPLTFNQGRSVFDKNYILIRKKGYITKKILLKKTITTAAIFNLSSILSWATDVTSGNMLKYSPTDYFIELQKKNHLSVNILNNISLKFTLTNHNHIIKQIARGEGEYLYGLLKTFNITNKKLAIYKLKENYILLLNEKNAYLFYKKLKNIFLTTDLSSIKTQS